MKNPFKNFKTKRQLREEIKRLSNLAPPLEFKREAMRTEQIYGIYEINLAEYEETTEYKEERERMARMNVVFKMAPRICELLKFEKSVEATPNGPCLRGRTVLRILVEEPDAKEK